MYITDKKYYKNGFDRGKLIIYMDKIIKVQEENSLWYVGFDIFSEIPYQIKKNPNAIELPEAVINLIGSEKMRFQLATCLSNTRYGMAKYLGVTERTLFRMCNGYDSYSDELLMVNKKKSDCKINGKFSISKNRKPKKKKYSK